MASKERRGIELVVSAKDDGTGEVLDKIEGKAGRAGARIEEIGKSASRVGGTLTAGLTVPIAAAATAATATAIKYENAFAGVRKTVDMTEEEFGGLYDATVALSETQPVSADELFRIEELGGQLGIANENLLSFAQVVSGMDIATDLGVEDAATQMAQFANITGMSQTDMERLGSSVVALGNNTATTESSIMAMAMRIAGAGASAGLSEADILGLSAALSSVGIEAEAGGSAISTIISNIDKSVATGSDSLETWAQTAGMSAEQFAAAWRDNPVQALSAVIEGMGRGVDAGGNLSLMLQELGITELRQTDAMKRLANAGDLLNDTVGVANAGWAENSALQNEVAARNDTTSAKLEVLRNRVENAAAKVGGPLADALVGVVDALGPVIDGVSDAAEWFAGLDTSTQQLVIGFGAAAAAAGPLLSAFGGAVSTVADLRDALGGLGGNASAAKGSLSGAGSVAEAASAAGDAIGAAAAGVDALDGKKATRVKKEIDAAEAAAGLATTAVEGTAAAVDLANAKKTTAVQAEVKKVGAEADSAKGKVGGVASAVGDVDAKTVSKVTGAVEGLGDAAVVTAGLAGDVGASIAGVNGQKTDRVQAEVGKVGEKADAAKGKASGLKAELGNVDGKGMGKVTGAVEGIGTAASNASKLLGMAGLAGAATIAAGAVLTIYNHLKSVAEQEQRVTDLAGGIGGALGDAYGTDSAPAVEGVSAVREEMAKLKEDIEDSAEGTLDLYENLAAEDFSIEQGIKQVENLADTIEELGSRSDLTEAEQVRLADAVERFESTTGASVSTIDEQTGALKVNADAVQGLAEAYAAQARYEGYSSGLKQLYAEQGQAQVDLAVAQEQARSALEAYNKAMEAGWTLADLFTGKLWLTDEGFKLLTADQKDAYQAMCDANDAVDTAQARVDGLAVSTEQYEQVVASSREEAAAASEVLADAAGAAQENAEASEAMAEATESATAALVDYKTASGQTVQVSEAMADALDGMADHVGEVAGAMREVGGPEVVAAVTGAGYTMTQFGLAIEATGGSVERFSAVYSNLEQLADPFEPLSASLAYTAENAAAADAGLGELAKTTDEIAAAIAADQATVDQFTQVVADLYAQCETQADIAFVDALVEKGPQALGELQNIAGTYEDANVSLHDLAGAQATLEQSIANSAVSAELERMGAAYRVLGTDALSGAWAVSESTGNILTSVGEGADRVVVELDSATGEVVSILSDTAPEAQAAAAQIKDAAASGVDGTAEALSGEAQDAAGGFSEGVASGAADAAGSGSLLGESSYGALASLPDEMEARGKVSGWSLASGLSSQSGKVSESASALSTAAGSALSALGGNMGTLGGSAGSSLAGGLSGARGQVSEAASSLSTAAGSALSGVPGAAWSVGNSAGAGLADGLRGAYGPVYGAGASLASAARGGVGNAGWAWSSGYGLGANFAGGMSAAYGLVYSAAASLAGAASRLLHHSVPDEGPLSDDDEWGYELGLNIAGGMERSAGAVREAALKLAKSAAVDMSSMVAPTADDLTAGGSGGASITIESMYVRDDTDIEKVARELHRLQRREGRRIA